MIRRSLSRRCLAVLAVLTFAACSDDAPVAGADVPTPFSACPAPNWAPQAGRTTQVMVPMRDCVRLATNVSLPEGPGPWPVIVIRTPYGKMADDFQPVGGLEALFVPHGYAVVNQDTRGRFRSEGTFVPLIHERQDTEDTLAWVELQPWYNGKLGVWGASYLGATAIMSAVTRPDLVDAAFVSIIRSDVYFAGFENGLLRADVGGMWAVAMFDPEKVDLPSPEVQDEAMLKFPLTEADRRTVGDVELDDVFFEHPEFDAFWLDHLDPAEWRATDVPLMMLTGWFDFLLRGQLEDWDAIFARRQGRDQWFVVGPWTHLMGFQFTHEYDFPGGGSIGNFVHEMMGFYDHYLKGDGPKPAMPTVQYYDGGTSAWRANGRLWPTATDNWTLYPRGTTTARDCAPAGTLEATPGTAEAASYDYDPRDPVILNGATVLDVADRPGMRRELDWCARPDALVFRSAPLSTAVELAGPIAVDLELASSAENTAFFARLSLIDSDDTVYNLREAAMVLTHREGNDRVAPYTPGDRVTMTLPMPGLRWTLQPGQALQLAISSSGYPLVVPHPNVGGDWMNARTPQVARQTVFTGADAATKLHLTVAD